MKIYNTLSRKIEEFHPINSEEVTMYSCGPTVYNYIHIGNARPIIIFDCFRKYLEYRGYKVKFVQNFTDIDDKIIKKANEENQTAEIIAKKYIEEYEKDAAGLGVSPPTIAPKVTKSIDIILKMVEKLISSGHACEAGGDVYFKTESFKKYGELSNIQIENLLVGQRIEINSLKKSPLDFALWKASKPGEPYWKSPWGNGRPGWHIECSAMAVNYLGKTIDIHCGGQDLIFPHHENEIAQSECSTNAKFANYWMHNGYINIDNEKMSKSKGNFLTVREIAEKHGYSPIRYMMLQAHYKTPINYSDEMIDQCKASLNRILTFKENLGFSISRSNSGTISKKDEQTIKKYRDDFIRVMDNDFNTADGISIIFEFIRDMNKYVSGSRPTSREHLQLIKDLFEELTNILGIAQKCNLNPQIPEKVLDLFEKRKIARKNKDFQTADQLREEIENLGFLVEETRQGSRILPKR